MSLKHWQLQRDAWGNVFIDHLVFPKFRALLTFVGTGEERTLTLRVRWEDPEPSGFDWYTEALAYYNFAQGAADRMPKDDDAPALKDLLFPSHRSRKSSG